MNRLLVLALALTALPLTSLANPRQEDRFLQGPEKVGEVRALAGTVIGIHPDPERTCYVVLADQPNRPQAAGLGGGGRFFLCDAHLELDMGQAWKGTAKQTGTRLARMGPRWRALPLFERT